MILVDLRMKEINKSGNKILTKKILNTTDIGNPKKIDYWIATINRLSKSLFLTPHSEETKIRDLRTKTETKKFYMVTRRK